MIEITGLDGFEFFKGKNNRLTVPYISIDKRGTISFNSEFVRQSKEILKNRVAIGFSKENNCICVLFLDEMDINTSWTSFKIVNNTNSRAISFSARSFFNSHIINTQEISGRYEFTYDSESQAIIINLDKKLG